MVKGEFILKYNKYTLLLCIFLILTGGLLIGSKNLESETVNNEFLIEYKSDEAKNEIIELSSLVINDFNELDVLAVKISEENLNSLVDNPNIGHIEENIDIFISQVLNNNIDNTNQSNHSNANQNILKQLNVEKAWTNNIYGNQVRIGILGTGISKHEGLTIKDGISVTDQSDNWLDENGHGTHIAGIIAANHESGIYGIAPLADIYAIKSMNKDGKGTLTDILKGIEWAIEKDLDILNLSFGTDINSDILKNMVNKAYNSGIIIVSASDKGTSSNGSITYPAKYKNVIAVNSIDQDLNLSSFSSKGPEIEYSSFGENIVSLHLNNKSEILSGSSQSAAYVTGVIALYKEIWPGMKVDEFRKKVQTFTIDLDESNSDSLDGYGLLIYHNPHNDTDTNDNNNKLEDQISENNTKSEHQANKNRMFTSSQETNHVARATSSDSPYFRIINDNAIMYDISSGTYKPVATLTKDHEFIRTGMSGNYYQVQYSNGYGYIHKGHTILSEGKSIKNESHNLSVKRTVQLENNAPIYDNTSGSFVEYANLKSGIDYKVADGGTNYWKVQIGNRVGFINKKHTSTKFLNSDKYFKVVSEKATVYQNTKNGHKPIGKLVKGQEYVRKGMSGNYHIIQYNGRNAIIHIGNTVVSNGEPIKNEFAQSYNGSYQIKI